MSYINKTPFIFKYILYYIVASPVKVEMPDRRFDTLNSHIPFTSKHVPVLLFIHFTATATSTNAIAAATIVTTVTTATTAAITITTTARIIMTILCIISINIITVE